MNSEINNIGVAPMAPAAVDGSARRLFREPTQDDLLELLLPLRRRWRLVVAGVAIAAATAGLVSRFAVTRWYRASAVLRPVAQPSVENRLAGMLGGFGGASGAATGAFGAPPGAQEDIAILKSFSFNVTLAEQHHLVRELSPRHEEERPEHATSRVSRWAVYNALQGRFTCQYSPTTGNLTLTYEDNDPAKAERILGFYIADLRDRLRRQELRDAAAAIESLQDEIKRASDTLLQQQLYELMAKQVERETLAQVEADFAFSVLDPPVTADRPSRPKIASNCLLAGLCAGFGLGAAIIGAGVASRARRSA